MSINNTDRSKPIGKITSVMNTDGGVLISASIADSLEKLWSAPSPYKSWSTVTTASAAWSSTITSPTTSWPWPSSYSFTGTPLELTDEEREMVQAAIVEQVVGKFVGPPHLKWPKLKAYSAPPTTTTNFKVWGTGEVNTRFTYDATLSWDET